ncbi:dipeptide/oligopeptide/nickel ABC transporter permease/ATP-binding protein [Phytohabitans sp. ZYX-F-186]|uniref:Dipeptide/oligopeptide/nickel ABC transporter permease/ATP-binding protein n=1 Tax=Phytohabitans maris TaxID=3071409 RepID=A0ABU0ZII3_9ACTN|nr:dipeptide/oligopeptide/nickel ABC transporter permease/ATP-binding protein [Phytohabitans sp. ZYX-F-186]MDQ7906095.1 dipeptide/oligopeptide/nickel ABC transporter permease/ATP-binding protein [Phytohabitans sp. ZYX-F-186]
MRRQLRTVFSTVTGSVAAVLLLLLVLLAIFGPIIWSGKANAIDVAKAWQPPSGEHWFGTDELGRDMFARSLVATRLSLLSAVAASGIAIVVGVPVGLLAAMFGPRLTSAFQSVVNVSIAFPALLTAMFVGTVIGIGVPGAILGVGIAMAPMFARLTQTLTASVISLDYVAAARTMGVPLRRLVGRHVLANVAEPLVITATTSVGTSLLGISALSFLGLGARPPQYDWGGLLSTGLKAIYTSPMAAIGPGTLIALSGIVFSLLGEVIAGAFGDNQSNRRFGRVARAMAAAARRLSAKPASPSDALLDVANLRVGFPSENGELPAVRGVSLRVAAGERVGIVGESGSGKSVSVMAIAQLVEHPAVVTADRLRFLGTELSTMAPAARRRFLGTNLAMVFQNPMSSLNPAMRIGTQLAEVAQVHSGLSASDARTRAADRLAEVGIADAGHRLRQYPHEFSGGMRQRAMIAMGLMETPRLIIADEPTTALDVTVQRQILDLLLAINRDAGAAILLISHDISVIANVCERVVVMYAGVVVEDLPVASLLRAAAHPYTRALIASVPDMTTDRDADLATIPGRPPALDDLPTGCPFASRCAFATDECVAQMPPLAPMADGHLAACWHPQGGAL